MSVGTLPSFYVLRKRKPRKSIRRTQKITIMKHDDDDGYYCSLLTHKFSRTKYQKNDKRNCHSIDFYVSKKLSQNTARKQSQLHFAVFPWKFMTVHKNIFHHFKCFTRSALKRWKKIPLSLVFCQVWIFLRVEVGLKRNG